jgi:hypothetical protein
VLVSRRLAWISTEYFKSSGNVKEKAPVRRLFEPEAFHFSKTIFRVLTKPLVWIW